MKGEIDFSLMSDEHPLSLLYELVNPIQIGEYKYTCLQHYLLHHMLSEYLKWSEKENVGDVIYIHKIIEDLRKTRNYQSFINYYMKWVIRPRMSDITLSFEYTISTNAIESDVWRDKMIKYYTQAYWLLFNEEKGLAISLQNKSIRCKIDEQISHQEILSKSIDQLIEKLRDRYIGATLIPLVESDKESITLHMLSCDDDDKLIPIRVDEISSFTVVRRHIRCIDVLSDDVEGTLFGIERERCEMIREYLVGRSQIDIDQYGQIPMDIYVELIEKNKGSCFGVISKRVDEILSDEETLTYLMEQMLIILHRYVH